MIAAALFKVLDGFGRVLFSTLVSLQNQRSLALLGLYCNLLELDLLILCSH